jgi:hypothetical protein
MSRSHWEEDRAGRAKNKVVWSSAWQAREQVKQDRHHADSQQQQDDEVLAQYQHRTGRY